MKIKTALGKEFECDSITKLNPMNLMYVHLSGTSYGEVLSVLSDKNQLPFRGYPGFAELKSISEIGSSRVIVSLGISKE